MQTCRIFIIACWFLVFATASPAQKNIKKTLTVRSVSYRAVPWENTTYYRTQGHSATDCYGSGTDYGYGSAVTLNCTTTTTPSQTYPITISKMFVHNQVESEGMIYTVGCTANWVGSHCSWLNPGDYFDAAIDGKNMLIEAARGGNQGKQIKIKYTILDIRARPEEHESSVTPASDAVSPATVQTPAIVVCEPGQTSAKLKNEPSPDGGFIEIACGTKVNLLNRVGVYDQIVTADFHRGYVAETNILSLSPNH